MFAKQSIYIAEKAKVIPLIRHDTHVKLGLRLRLTHYFEFVPSTDIVHMEAMGNYTRVFLTSGKACCYSRSIKQAIQQAGQQHFMRLHQSFAVNKKAVDQIATIDNQWRCMLRNGTTLPIARRRKQAVRAWFDGQLGRTVPIK